MKRNLSTTFQFEVPHTLEEVVARMEQSKSNQLLMPGKFYHFLVIKVGSAYRFTASHVFYPVVVEGTFQKSNDTSTQFSGITSLKGSYLISLLPIAGVLVLILLEQGIGWLFLVIPFAALNYYSIYQQQRQFISRLRAFLIASE